MNKSKHKSSSSNISAAHLNDSKIVADNFSRIEESGQTS